MHKQLVLTCALLSALGLSTSSQALDWNTAKDLFDAPAPTQSGSGGGNGDEPISDLVDDDENVPPPRQLPGDNSEKQRGESEPNNSADSSDPIESGIQYIGQMYGPEDQDWYHISTTQNNEILTIQTAVANDLWLFTVKDRAGNTLASATNQDSDGVVRTGDDVDPDLADEFKMSVTVEKAGTYYIVVSPAPDLYGTRGEVSFQDFSSQNYHMEVTLSDPTNPDNPVLDSNFHDLETEPNNNYLRADPLASNKLTLGQLSYASDEDWFQINSPGNEIIELIYCGFVTSCSSPESRVVLVLNKEFIDAQVQNALFNGIFVTEEGITYDNLPFRMIEYLQTRGALRDALVGKIHPDFGSDGHLQIGIDLPGTYYIVVTGKLERDQLGRIDNHVEIEDVPLTDAAGDEILDPFGGVRSRLITKVEPFFTYVEHSDDQYSIRVIRNDLAPGTSGSLASIAERERAKFDNRTSTIHIPELDYNGSVFEADLIHRDGDDRNMFELLQLIELDQ